MNTRLRWTLVLLAALLGVGAAITVASAWWSSTSSDSVPQGTVSSPADRTPSTNASRAPSAGPPATTVPPSSSSSAPASGPTRVNVVTTFAGWNATSGAVEVGGYATVVERAGTCTLRLSHGDRVVLRTRTASADATTVSCGGFSVPRSELTAGGWQAVLSYTSSTSKGQATTVTVQVP